MLSRHSPLRVTARSIGWGAVVMVPLAIAEWLGGARPVVTPASVAGALYLAVVITAFGYLLWNWALARVAAPQVAVFVTVQPIGGAILGITLLHEPLTAFTVAGGALIVLGLSFPSPAAVTYTRIVAESRRYNLRTKPPTA